MDVEKIPSNSVLVKYIENGKVDYQRLKTDPWIKSQINIIQNNEIEELSKAKKLAFWLNAYNLTTINSVLGYLKKNSKWKGVTTLWSKFKFFIWDKHLIAGRKISLYNLENKIIRKFGDPRIHFALNCASGSCPYLPGALFDGDNLDKYLEDLTHDFINDQGGATYHDNTLYLSKIFKMYQSDFGGSPQDLKKFVQNYWKGEPLSQSLQIKFKTYDWSLNQQ